MTAAEFLKKLRAAINAESKRHHKQTDAPQKWSPIKDEQFNELLTNNNEFSIEEINGALAAISELDASNEIFNNLQTTLIESIERPGKTIMWYPDRDWELSTPWSEIIIGGGITEEIGNGKWSSFQDKYLPITNGRFELPDNFSPTKGADLELDKEIIRDIQSKAKSIQDALKQNYLAQLRINPNATDDEIFRSLLLGGPSGLLESDVSGISTGSLLDYLPELIMPQTIEAYQGGATGGRFPDDTPSSIIGDTYTDSAGNVRNNNSYRPGTADIPHVVTNRNGKETYYDENWQEVSPPREDVGPVAFEPDSRYFERDPVTGEWKLNEALSNLPLGEQAQFDNRFKLAEEAMSNIQKGGQLGINFAAQDLKGREYLDDMLRDPGSSLMRMANFRGDPQWKGGPRFQGVSPANRFNDYQNYYGGLNEQLRNLFANQGLFNPPPGTTAGSTTQNVIPHVNQSLPQGPAFPGSQAPPGSGPSAGLPSTATLPPSAGPGTGPNALPDPNIPNPSTGPAFIAPATGPNALPDPNVLNPSTTASSTSPGGMWNNPNAPAQIRPPAPVFPGTIAPPGGGPSAGLPTGPAFPGITPPPPGGSPILPPPVVPPGGPGNLPPPPNIITPPSVGKGPPIFKGPGNSPPPPMNVPPAIDIGSDKGLFNPPGSVKTSGNRFATGSALNNFMAQLAKEKENNRKLRLRPPVTSRRGSFG